MDAFKAKSDSGFQPADTIGLPALLSTIKNVVCSGVGEYIEGDKMSAVIGDK